MVTLAKYIVLYAIYFLGITAFLLSISGKVRYGLLFLIPLLPLQNVMTKLQYLPFGKDFNDILLIGMLIGWLYYKNSKGKPVTERNPFNGLLLVYLLFTYITLWRGSAYLGFPAPISALDPRLQTWKNYMILPLIFFIVFNTIENRDEMKRLFLFMCGAMLLMNFYTMRQLSWITAWWNRTKIEGTFVWLGANEIAAFYATYTFVLIGIFLLTKHKIWKIGLGVLIFQNFFCDLFLFSRGAYLATLLGGLFISVLRSKKLIIPILLILVFWQVLLPEDVVARLQFSEQAGHLDASAQTRLILWEQSIRYFRENPIIGVGFNIFHHLGIKRDAHNLFLRTLAEQGIVGAGFLLLIMLLAFSRAFRLYKSANDTFLKGLGLGFSACTVAVMVGNIFGDRWTYLQLGGYFWVFMAMVERGHIITMRENMALAAYDKGSKKNNKGTIRDNEGSLIREDKAPVRDRKRRKRGNKGINLAQSLRGNGRKKRQKTGNG